MANVNIVKDYSWTSVPRGSQLREEAPVVYVRGFELDTTQLKQFVDGYLNIANNTSGDSDSFYKNLYKGKAKDTYFFPYFSDNVRSFSNEFADTFSNFSSKGSQAAGAGALQAIAGEVESLAGGATAITQEVLKAAERFGSSDVSAAAGKISQAVGAGPGSYIETPKFYQFANTDAALDVSFTLANTIEDGDYEKNNQFIKDFTRANRPKRLTSLSVTFPQIYKVKVPGVRFIEWAYLSNFSIKLVGTRRKINNVIVPEGYEIDMSFTSLTMEPSNFLDKV